MLEAKNQAVFTKRRESEISFDQDSIETLPETYHVSSKIPDLTTFVENFDHFEQFAKLPFAPSEHETQYKETTVVNSRP